MATCPHCLEQKPQFADTCPHCTHRTDPYEQLGFSLLNGLIGNIVAIALMVILFKTLFSAW